MLRGYRAPEIASAQLRDHRQHTQLHPGHERVLRRHRDVTENAGRGTVGRAAALDPPRRVLRRDRKALVRPKHLAVSPPVVEYLLGGHRGLAESSLHAGPPSSENVSADACAQDLIHDLYLLGAETLDTAKVQESHTSVLVEDVVAGVWVGVELIDTLVAAIDEAEDCLSPLIA